MAKISVIIPTYNRVSFLQKAIESVIGQTFEDYELLIVDDGSTDTTREIVASFGSADITYIHQANKGVSAARNAGILAANSEFLAFLDSDDCFAPAKLATQYHAMQDNPLYLVSHTDELWYRRGKILNQKKKHLRCQGMIFMRCLQLCAVGMSTVMVRSSLFERYGLFDEELPCCEDYDLWLRVSAQQPFLLVTEPLTIKDGGRQDQLSVIHRIGIDKYRIKAIVKLLESSALDLEQKIMAADELEKKCLIYGHGCLKHGRDREGHLYLSLATRYKA